MRLLATVVCLLAASIAWAVRLDSYNVARNSVSVSGVSSGACMATQFHVAHSRDVMGVALIAGVPFMCSGGTIAASLACAQTPSLITVTPLEAIVASADLVGNVDDTSNMRNDKVWIFSGTHDSVVRPAAGPKVQQFYEHYVTASNIKTVFNIPAEHCVPTKNYGGQCDRLSTTDFLNNCDYDGAFELLNHIYGGHLKAPTTASGQLIQFDQGDFFYFSGPSTYSMDDVGYVYVPTGCLDKHTACKLHIAFHGCAQGQSKIGDAFVRHGGYNEAGEANNIIILYPQVIARTLLGNPQGCWDWWGYSGLLFATKSGFQMTAVYRMMEHVMGL